MREAPAREPQRSSYCWTKAFRLGDTWARKRRRNNENSNFGLNSLKTKIYFSRELHPLLKTKLHFQNFTGLKLNLSNATAGRKHNTGYDRMWGEFVSVALPGDVRHNSIRSRVVAIGDGRVDVEVSQDD